MATDDPGQICSLCRVYIPVGEPFKKSSIHTYCLDCASRLGLQQPVFFLRRLGRLFGSFTPHRRLIGVAAVLCFIILIGTWGWTYYEEADDEEDYSRASVIRVWASSVASLDKVLRLRGDLSQPAVKRARRDQLLLMCTGMDPDDAVEMLEVFAEKKPKALATDWIRAAYAWLGKRPNVTRGQSYTDCSYFTRRFLYKSPEVQATAAEAGYDLIIDSPANSFWVGKAMGLWFREAENGLVAWPSDSSQSWSFTSMQFGVPPALPVYDNGTDL